MLVAGCKSGIPGMRFKPQRSMPKIKLPVLYIVEMEMMNPVMQKQKPQEVPRERNLRKEVLQRKANLIQQISSRFGNISHMYMFLI